jgi:hypothetical protein
MPTITANDLKTRGVAAIEAALAERSEAVVSVRGAERFVVMELAHYHHLRECEIEAALIDSRADVAAGRFVKESPAAHIARALASRTGSAAQRKARSKPAVPAKSPRKSASAR